MREKLLELIKEETDMYSYNEIVNENYNESDLIKILDTLVKINRMEEQ